MNGINRGDGTLPICAKLKRMRSYLWEEQAAISDEAAELITAYDEALLGLLEYLAGDDREGLPAFEKASAVLAKARSESGQ